SSDSNDVYSPISNGDGDEIHVFCEEEPQPPTINPAEFCHDGSWILVGTWDEDNFDDIGITVSGTEYKMSNYPSAFSSFQGAWSVNLQTLGISLNIGQQYNITVTSYDTDGGSEPLSDSRGVSVNNCNQCEGGDCGDDPERPTIDNQESCFSGSYILSGTWDEEHFDTLEIGIGDDI